MAAGIGGDPLDLLVERFNVLLFSIPDIENWKAGESDEKRRDRILFEKLEGLM